MAGRRIRAVMMRKCDTHCAVTPDCGVFRLQTTRTLFGTWPHSGRVGLDSRYQCSMERAWQAVSILHAIKPDLACQARPLGNVSQQRSMKFTRRLYQLGTVCV